MSLSRVVKSCWVVGILAVTLALAGCPSEEVVVVDDHPEINLDEIDGNEYTFDYSGDASTPIEVGDIIAGSEGGGYLRRVMAVDQADTTVTTDTEFVSLAEAVDVGVLDADVEFTAKDFAKAGLPMVKDGDTKIDISGTVLFSDGGLSVTIVRGIIDFAPTVKLDATWSGHRLAYLRALTEGELAVDMDVEFKATGAQSFAYEVDVFPPVELPFTFSIGPIPVVGTAYLSFPFGVVGSVTGTASIVSGFDSVSYITLGGEYNGDGWNDLSSFSGFDPNGHAPVLSLSSDAGIDVFVKPTAGLNLYSVSDLSGSLIPYVSADAVFLPPPATFLVGAGIDGIINYELGIFDLTLIDESWYFPGPYWELYSWSADE